MTSTLDPELDHDWRQDKALEAAAPKDTAMSKKQGGIVDFADGHIEGYNLDAVLRMGFFRMKVPVFADPFVTVQMLYVVAMVGVTAASLIVTHKTSIMMVDENMVAQSSDIFGYFGGLAGFLFGFYVFDNLGTYSTIKGAYLGGFWGYACELMAMTGVWFPETDAATTEFKTTVVRWNLASYALMCYTADPECTPDQGIANCAARGLLTAEEAALVASLGGNAVLPLQWVFGVFAQNLEGRRGRDFKMDKVESKVLQIRGSIGSALAAVSSFGLTPLPLVHLMSALVKMQLFLLGLKEGVNCASIVVGESSGKVAQIFFSLLMAVSTPVIFQGLLEFVIMIRNPFGKDWVDFPTLLFHKQIRNDMLQLIHIAELGVDVPFVKQAMAK